MADTTDIEQVIVGYKIDLAKNALEAYKSRFADLSDIWKSIDAKAQGTVTIAGIFIGGAFTLARSITHTTPAEQIILMILLVVLLCATVLFAASALLARRAKRLMTNRSPKEIYSDTLYALDDCRTREPDVTGAASGAIGEAHETTINYFRTILDTLDQAVQSMSDAVKKKGEFLRFSQYSLLAAIVCAAFWLLMIIAQQTTL